MSGQRQRGKKRPSYSHSSGSSTAGAFLKSAFILLIALAGSFILGFTVLAKIIPQPHTDSSTSSSSNSGGDTTNPALSKKNSALTGSPPARTLKVAGTNGANSGPEIQPDNSVQKPDSVDPSSTTGTDGLKHSNQTETEKTVGSSGDDSGDATVPTSPKRDKDGGKLQIAGSPDSGSSADRSPVAGSPNKPNGNLDPEVTPVKNGLYRVQIGVYSTREKAEEVAQNAADKKIRTTVIATTREGRTLYRVQYRARKDKNTAEEDKQKLIDAGFDATISSPTS